MGIQSESANKIRSLSTFIYGEDRGAKVAEGLTALISAREGPLRAAGALRGNGKAESGSGLSTGSAAPAGFSERDALLITYGDMVGKDGRFPSALATLGDFLSRRAKGLFSHVHFLPFFPYSSDDGFSVIDYRAIDPKLGTWDDVRRIGANFRLAFDLVLNHGSVRSDWFADFLSGKGGKRSWYLTRPADYDASSVFRPRTHPLLTAFARPDGSEVSVWTTFSPDQADFDFNEPEVLYEFVSIFLDYAERGARVVRLDAIAFLWKEDGTPCLHHPKTHGIVKLFRAIVDALDLDLVILTETNVPHRENVSYWGSGDEALMVYNFALPPLVLHASVSGDAGPLRRWARSLPDAGNGPAFLNFTASHDGIGVGPAKGLVPEAEFAETLEEVKRRGALVSYKTAASGPVPYEINCSYLDAVAPPDAEAATRARAFLATQAVALSLAGLPAVYFHSWVGSENWKEGLAALGYNRAINREKPPLERLERELRSPGSVRFLVNEGFRRLLEFRSGHRAFASSAPQRVLESEGPVFAILRGPDGDGHAVLCAENFSGSPAFLDLPGELGTGAVRLAPWETKWIAFPGGETVCI